LRYEIVELEDVWNKKNYGADRVPEMCKRFRAVLIMIQTHRISNSNRLSHRLTLALIVKWVFSLIDHLLVQTRR